MRILFTPLAWPTHYYPTIATIWACRVAGHEVRVATQPALTDAVRQSGLIPMTIGRDYDVNTGLAENARQLRSGDHGAGPVKVEDLLKSPDGMRRLREARLEPHVKAAEASVDDLLAVIRFWKPDLVVSDPVVMAAPLAAQVSGIPLVRHLWGPDPTPQLGFPGWGLPVADWPSGLLALYERYDAVPAVDAAVATVDPCPAGLQAGGIIGRLPTRYIPYNGTAEVPDWLLSDVKKPRVCVTWGMSNSELVGKEHFRLPDVLRILTDMGSEVVAAVAGIDHDALGDQPDNVRIVRELPLQLVLPTCDAIVHHGGAGTMLTAAAYGVPQVVIAPIMSQSFNADRLAAYGAGLALKAEECGIGDITAAIEQTLRGSAIAGKARELRAEIAAQPSLADIVGELEKLARGTR